MINELNPRKNWSGRCSFKKVLGGYYGIPIRNSVSFKQLMSLHEIVHTLSEKCLEKAVLGTLTSTEYAAFLHEARCFQHFVDALQMRATDFLIEVDELTGLLMRNNMEAQLEDEWARVQRTGTVFCIAMLDIDYFKPVNDEHGHVFGDLVLADLANKLVDGLRPYDRIYRYGGEEFLLLLPETSLEEAQVVLNRLRDVIAENKIGVGKKTVRLTVSIGLTQYDTESDIPTLIKQADAALYQAKNAGRNLVMTAT
jgi:diguanylate cyclase (GGDEF)-like protein